MLFFCTNVRTLFYHTPFYTILPFLPFYNFYHFCTILHHFIHTKPTFLNLGSDMSSRAIWSSLWEHWRVHLCLLLIFFSPLQSKAFFTFEFISTGEHFQIFIFLIKHSCLQNAIFTFIYIVYKNSEIHVVRYIIWYLATCISEFLKIVNLCLSTQVREAEARVLILIESKPLISATTLYVYLQYLGHFWHQ